MDYLHGCFCSIDKECLDVCKQYGMAINMAKYDQGGGCSCGLQKQCDPECQWYTYNSNMMKLESFKPNNVKLDMNKVKYDWCYDVLIRINEVMLSNNSNEDKLHAIAWLTKQGLK
jgi:hypothetical protein